MNEHGQYNQFSFRFVPGTLNGRDCMMAQVWLRDAVFCTVEQGFWDAYAFRFKWPHWADMPKGLANAIDYAFKAQFNPKRKDFRELQKSL